MMKLIGGCLITAFLVVGCSKPAPVEAPKAEPAPAVVAPAPVVVPVGPKTDIPKQPAITVSNKVYKRLAQQRWDDDQEAYDVAYQNAYVANKMLGRKKYHEFMTLDDARLLGLII